MSETHYAVIGNAKPMIPAAEYQSGDIVTTKDGSYRITGRPHRQWYGLMFGSVRVFWPAERVDFASIPAGMRFG